MSIYNPGNIYELFPTNPADEEQYVLWDKAFTYYGKFDAWLPEEFNEPVNTASNREYMQYVLSGTRYVLLNKNLYYENTR